MNMVRPFLIACTLAQTLQTLRPKAEWAIRGSSYSDMEWLDKSQSKPTQEEVATAMSACESAQTNDRTAKAAAKVVIKDSKATEKDKLNAVILLLDLDR